MATWFSASNLTPADPNSLQEVVPFEGAYTDLVTGDKCLVTVNGENTRIYIYDETSTESEDFFLTVVIPTANATGTGAWVEKRITGIMSAFQGTMANEFDLTVSEAGGVVSADFEASGGIPGLGIFNNQFVTVPVQSVTLTAGSDASPTPNYVHILGSDPTNLAVSTSNWPTAFHIKVAFLLVPSAAYVASAGPYINQNWNDGNHVGEEGHIRHIGEAIRLTMQGATWHSGVAANGATDGYITIDAGDTPDSVYFLSTAGVAYQMHQHTIPAIDTSGTDDIHVVNSSVAAYNSIQDISDEVADSTGGSLNNKYYNVVIAGVCNKTGEYSPLLMNMPSGSYNTATGAINDTSGYDVYDLPHEFVQDSCTAFLICRITFRNQGGNLTVQNTTDLRGRTPGTASGSVIASDVEFPDNQFRIFDEADDTREIAFSADGITTGNTRTITMPDADTTLLTQTEVTDLTDGGNTDLHQHDTLNESAGGLVSLSAVTDGILVRDTNGTDSNVILTSDGGSYLANYKATSTYAAMQLYVSGFENAIIARHNGAVELYYDNTAVAKTIISGTDSGLSVYDSDSQYGQLLKVNTGMLLLYNREVSGHVTLAGTDSGSAYSAVLVGDPDDAIQLFYNGLRALATTAVGIDVFDTSGGEANIIYKTSGGAKMATLLANTTYALLTLGTSAENALKATLNGAVELYYNDAVALKTAADGVDVLSGTNDDPVISLYEDDGSTLVGTFRSNGASDLYITSERNGGDVWIYGKDETGTAMWAGIDVSSPAFRPSPDSTVNLGNSSYCWLNIYGDAGVTSCSDEKYKKDVQQTTLGLQFIDDLVPVAFKFRTDGLRPKNHHRFYQGMLANEVEAVLQDHGHTYADFAGLTEDFDDEGNRWLGLKYEQFIGPLIKATQQLHSKVKTQRQRIIELETQMTAVLARLDVLETT